MTNSALPSTDMERRNLDDWGGGSTTPGAADEGRGAGMNSCLQNCQHQVRTRLMGEMPTCKSPDSWGRIGKRFQRATYLRNNRRSWTGRAGAAGDPR